MFNPSPRVQAVPIAPGYACYVIDDALLQPERWVEHAAKHRAEFGESPRNAFPGPELPLPTDALTHLERFFAMHVRRALGGRRTLWHTGRMSLVTRTPEQLMPWQWICHRDRLNLEPGQSIAACVLYLFRDPALGGTAFYAPTRPVEEIAELSEAANSLSPEAFTTRYGVAAGYMTESNAWFRKLQSIPARWNRLIFYSGMIPHSGEIARPDLLDGDPHRGRLTVNGFFGCTRSASA